MNENRANVAISVDFDATCIWMSWGATGARVLSRGEFGVTTGAPRLLDLFERYSVPTTWFIPGHTAETWPEVTRNVASAGHEVGNHGYFHEAFDKLDLDEAIAVIRRSNRALESLTGAIPRGMRIPAGDFHADLLEALVAEGFDYDSSLLGGDFYPYWCRSEDEHTDGPTLLGKPIDLVEIAIGFITNDFNHFEFNYDAPKLVGHHAPSVVEEIWKSQFDYMYANCPGGTLALTLHPQSIGHGGRMLMLERFIAYCQSHEGVRFLSQQTVVDEFRANNPATSL